VSKSAPAEPKLGRDPLPPPPGLPVEAAALWREITNSLPADHFAACHVPLLEAYCTLAIRQREAITKDRGGPKSDWLKVRLRCAERLASLATKLRLTPQSTVATTAARFGQSRRRRESEPGGKFDWRGLGDRDDKSEAAD